MHEGRTQATSRIMEGKTTRKIPSRVAINKCDESPKELLERHGKIT